MNSRALIKGFFDSRSVSGPSAALVNHPGLSASLKSL